MRKISVIIPMYNVKRYLNDCLDSVAEQTLNDFEVIAINDGSTDDTLEIAQSYSLKIPNLTILSSENRGPGHARNMGLDVAEGEYVKFLDADDELENPDTLKRMYEVASRNESDVLVGTYNAHFGPISIKPAYHTLGAGKSGVVDLKVNRNYPFQEMPSIGDKLFRRDHIGDLRFPETQWEDLPVVPLLMADAKSLYFLDEDVCKYRMRLNNTSIGGCLFAHDIFEFLKVYEYILKGFKDRNLDKEYEKELMGLFAMHGSFDVTTSLFWTNMTPAEKKQVITLFIAKIEQIYPNFIEDPILQSYYKDHPIFKKMFYYCHSLSRRTFNKMHINTEDLDVLVENLFAQSKVLKRK